MSNRADYVVAALLQEGIVSQEAHDTCLAESQEKHESMLDVMIANGVVTRRQVAIMRAEISECVFVDLDMYEINIRNAGLLDKSAAQRFKAFVLFECDTTLTIGMADPLDLNTVDQLRRLLRKDIETVLCEEQALEGLINRAYSLNSGSLDTFSDSTSESQSLVTGEEPVVAAVNQILDQAITEGASDIHIGPDEHELHLRYRIDGSLVHRHGPPRSAHSGIVQRLKVMASLDLTQTRRPQDGKFRYMHAGKPVDIRLSLIPTIYGENVVMRVLASGAEIRDFAELGIDGETVSTITELLARPYGMFLVTGPTGSGKTTTLYTAIKTLNTPDKNVMTIEDPVEIRMPMVRQIQVNAEIGMTFAGALRSVLRQDPDVVLIGEIRDEETARIACQAALTGHMVLSTLHTNDATGSVGRLRDMGVPPFAINAALLGVLAQRLVRRNCQACVGPYEPESFVLRQFGLEGAEGPFIRGTGCNKCMQQGMRGRLSVTELMVMNGEIRSCIEEDAGSALIRERAIASGMKPMWRVGMENALLGLTTLEEVAKTVAISLDEHEVSLASKVAA